VFVQVRDPCRSFNVSFAPFPHYFSGYQIDTVSGNDINIPSLLHLAFPSNIVSIILSNVVLSIVDCSACRVVIFRLLLLPILRPNSLWVSVPWMFTQLSEPEFVYGLHWWWNDAARTQRAHCQHAAKPLVAFQMEFMKISRSGSRSIGSGLDHFLLSSSEDPRNIGQTESDPKIGKIDCGLCCMRGWYEMRWDVMNYNMR